jgi:hypothetical protein
MRRLVLAWVVCTLGCAGGQTRSIEQALATQQYFVRADQLGYLPDDSDRFAVVLSSGLPAPHYRIVVPHLQLRATASPVHDEPPVAEGVAGPRVLDETSRAGARIVGDRIDLSTLRPGGYFLVLDDGTTAQINIDARVYGGVFRLITQFLAEQRCGPTTAAVSKHGPCHLFGAIGWGHSGDGLAVDDGTRPPYAGAPAVDVEGGWHDSGDYIKFVGTTAYTLAVELSALRDHTRVHDEHDRARGEHARDFGPNAGALARELRWGLDWLLKMVAGSELYHQVGGEGDHDAGWRVPEEDTVKPIPAYDHRPVFRMAPGRGRNLLGRSAAAFAFGSEVYVNEAAYSARLLAAAKKTYILAKERAGVQNPDPPDFYEEPTGDDDLVLGAAALAHATGETAYAKEAYSLGVSLHAKPGSALSWHSVDAMALLEAARVQPAGSSERAELAAKLEALAAPLAAAATSPRGAGSPFGSVLAEFGKNSTGESLGVAATCAAAHALGVAPGCDVVARRQLHWVFGQNPFGIDYLVGSSYTFPRHLHHSFGQARLVPVFIEGALAGGPTALHVLESAGLRPPSKDDPFARWSTDDLLYEDKAEDYICNKPAIDFGAALVYTVAELANVL